MDVGSTITELVRAGAPIASDCVFAGPYGEPGIPVPIVTDQSPVFMEVASGFTVGRSKGPSRELVDRDCKVPVGAVVEPVALEVVALDDVNESVVCNAGTPRHVFSKVFLTALIVIPEHDVFVQS